MILPLNALRWQAVLFSLYLLVVGSAVGSIWAQESPTSTRPQDVGATPPVAEQQPKPIAAEEVAGRATATLSTVRELLKVAKPDPSVEEIAEEMPAVIATIDHLSLDPISQKPSEHAPSLLSEAQLQWLRYLNRFGDWRKSINDRAKRLQEGISELRGLQDVWQLTAGVAGEEDWPEVVASQIQLALTETAKAISELQAQYKKVLTLQNQVSEQVVIITEILERIDAALVASRDKIFFPNLPPIWKLGEGKELQLSAGEVFRPSWQRLRSGVQEFLAGFRSRILLHLFCFAVLAGLIFLLHRWARRYLAEDESHEAITSILGRPIAAAFVLSIIFSDLFFPTAPLVIDDLLGIMVLPAAAWLVPSLVPPSLRRTLYALLVLSFISILADLLVAHGPFRRFVLLGIAIFVLINLTRLRRRTRTTSLVTWPRVISFVTSAGRVIFSAALLANAGGYVALAEVLTYGTIYSGYVAFLVLAGVRIMESLVAVSLRTRVAQSLASIRFNVDSVQRRISRFLRMVAFVTWAVVTLQTFHLMKPMLAWLAGWLERRWQVGQVQISIASILLFFIVIWITLWISRIVRSLLNQDILPRASLSRGISSTVSMLVNYTILGFGILLALAAAGIRMEQFALVAGALGVGIGFGLQTIVSNFISGLILIFERPIQIGDTVEVGLLLGQVRRIGIRSSTVRTFDGAEVIVPNNDLIAGQVVNWTLSDQLRRIEVKVGVAYGTDPHRVLELLVNVAREHEKALTNPAPHALFLGFGDSSLNFALRFWTADFEHWIQTASEVTVGVNDALKEAGISIPFPQRDLHVRSIDPPAAEMIKPMMGGGQGAGTGQPSTPHAPGG